MVRHIRGMVKTGDKPGGMEPVSLEKTDDRRQRPKSLPPSIGEVAKRAYAQGVADASVAGRSPSASGNGAMGWFPAAILGVILLLFLFLFLVGAVVSYTCGEGKGVPEGQDAQVSETVPAPVAAAVNQTAARTGATAGDGVSGGKTPGDGVEDASPALSAADREAREFLNAMFPVTFFMGNVFIVLGLFGILFGRVSPSFPLIMGGMALANLEALVKSLGAM